MKFLYFGFPSQNFDVLICFARVHFPAHLILGDLINLIGFMSFAKRTKYEAPP
jgi:hypothetical protein